MTIEELLNTKVPLPLAGPGIGLIRHCDLADIQSARRCIARDQSRYAARVHLLPVLNRLEYRFKRDEAANVVEDLRYFALMTAITGPKTSKRLRALAD